MLSPSKHEGRPLRHILRQAQDDSTLEYELLVLLGKVNHPNYSLLIIKTSFQAFEYNIL